MRRQGFSTSGTTQGTRAVAHRSVPMQTRILRVLACATWLPAALLFATMPAEGVAVFYAPIYAAFAIAMGASVFGADEPRYWPVRSSAVGICLFGGMGAAFVANAIGARAGVPGWQEGMVAATAFAVLAVLWVSARGRG